jgi:hypothetical protein
MNATPRSARYEIIVKDRLSDRFGHVFPGVEIEEGPGRTVLTGEFQDQSQLHGLLDRLQDFGIELVSINAVD